MHKHAHGLHDARPANRKRLTLVLALVVTYMIAEVVGGIVSNSLALLADAGHMLSDAAALGLSLFAARLADRPPTKQRTYGYYRSEILAALLNGAALMALALLIAIETFSRLQSPPEVRGLVLLSVASGGLLVNAASLWILNAGRSSSLNVRGAWLHVLSDTLGSVGAIVAGILVWRFGWRMADPIVSLAIAVLILYSSWSLISESVDVLMENVPAHIDALDVRECILESEGVTGVHDLHVWTITSGLVACSAHVTVEQTTDRDCVLGNIDRMLAHRFDIQHTTIQIEEAGPCEMQV